MKLSLPKSILFATVLTLLGLAAIEVALGLFGIRPAYLERDPYVGFANSVPLFTVGDDGHTMRTSGGKLRFFNDQSFAQPKRKGTYRIFCPGESTTYGHPFRDPTSFPGWLRAYLRDVAPDRRWDVINAGGISYASHRIAAMMEELIRYEPDLFILYVGHNEFLEDQTYADVRDESPIRRHAKSLAYRTRAASLALRMRDRMTASRAESSGEVHTLLDDSIGPGAYHRDEERRREVVRRYETNLRRMVELARSVGAEVIFVTPASSLRDCSPFKSEPSPSLTPEALEAAEKQREEARKWLIEGKPAEAEKALSAAVASDALHAGGRYLLAEALHGLGQVEEARTHYMAAKDEDVVPVRAISVLVETVRHVAREEGVPLVDYVAMLDDWMETHVGHRTPGAELFLDHVHPTIDGNRLLAEALFDVLKSRGVVDRMSSIDDAVRLRVRASVEGAIDAREQGLALRNVAKVLSWAGKSDDAARLAAQAATYLGPDAECLFIQGIAAQERKDWVRAEALYGEAVALDSAYVKALHNHGIALANLGRIDEALAAYDQVIALSPDHPYVRYNVAHALYRGGRDEEARAAFAVILKENPDDEDARFYMDELTKAVRK